MEIMKIYQCWLVKMFQQLKGTPDSFNENKNNNHITMAFNVSLVHKVNDNPDRPGEEKTHWQIISATRKIRALL